MITVKRMFSWAALLLCCVSCTEKTLEVSTFDLSLRLADNETVVSNGEQINLQLVTNRPSITVLSISGEVKKYYIDNSEFVREMTVSPNGGVVDIKSEQVTCEEKHRSKVTVVVRDDSTGAERTVSVSFLMQPLNGDAPNVMEITDSQGFDETANDYGDGFGGGFVLSSGESLNLTVNLYNSDDKSLSVDKSFTVTPKVTNSVNYFLVSPTSYSDKEGQITVKSKGTCGQVTYVIQSTANELLKKEITLYVQYPIVLKIGLNLNDGKWNAKVKSFVVTPVVQTGTNSFSAAPANFSVDCILACYSDNTMGISSNNPLAALNAVTAAGKTTDCEGNIDKLFNDKYGSFYYAGAFNTNKVQTCQGGISDMYLYLANVSNYNRNAYKLVGEYHSYRKSANSSRPNYFWAYKDDDSGREALVTYSN